jgi:hypothetical protein
MKTPLRTFSLFILFCFYLIQAPNQGVVIQAYKPCTQGAEARGSGIQREPELHRRACLKTLSLGYGSAVEHLLVRHVQGPGFNPQNGKRKQNSNPVES